MNAKAAEITGEINNKQALEAKVSEKGLSHLRRTVKAIHFKANLIYRTSKVKKFSPEIMGLILDTILSLVQSIKRE
jgi:hypothetical protein